MARGRNPPRRPADRNDVTDPREEREVHIEMQSLSWNAPIPPPDILRGYNEILPDGAERLFRQFEIEAAERREYMRRGQTHNLIVALSGRAAALVFALSALGVSAFALYLGHSVAAGVIGGTTIAMVVAAFTGVPALLRKRAEQRQDKR